MKPENGQKKKLIRITTIPLSLRVLLKHQLRYMSDHFEVVAVSSPDKDLSEVAKQEQVKVLPVAMTRSITPLQDLKSLLKLYRIFQAEAPSIVHTHTPKAGLLGMLAAKIAGVPVRMHTVAGLPLMESRGIKRNVLEFVERLTYKFATKVYPNSFNLAQFILQRKFCKLEKLKVLGNGSSNGINTEYFKENEALAETAKQLQQELSWTNENFVFVFVGRLVRDKGIEELVEAFTNLQTKYSHCRLLLVGPYESHLDPISEETSKKISENKNIVHTGFQQDVRPYYMISSALVFPSYREGFPNVPMQAGCFDLPSIVSDINGCNEIVVHNKNGLIVPVKDVVTLQREMEGLIENHELYMSLKSNARRMIVERFDQRHLWGLLLNEYNEQLHCHALS